MRDELVGRGGKCCLVVRRRSSVRLFHSRYSAIVSVVGFVLTMWRMSFYVVLCKDEFSSRSIRPASITGIARI